MPFSEVQKSKHPCLVCAKRKVKCDRLVPCSNCVKRGFEEECLRRSFERDSEPKESTLPKALRFWQRYEYWIADIGLLKCRDIDTTERLSDLKENLNECSYWCTYLKREQSFALLDYSMEKLGVLYFGCLSDISELYLILEDYWQRRDEEIEGNIAFPVDDHYWDALLWSIFCLAVYYMPLEVLQSIFPERPSHHSFSTFANDGESGEWTETSQLKLLKVFEQCTETFLLKSHFLANPDIKLVQTYLILSSTNYSLTHSSLSDSLLLQSFHTAKVNHVNDFKPLVGDSTSLRLVKITCEKIWYRLCVCDYLQTTPSKSIVFHTELSSLLQHAAYLEDLPTVDVYQSEDSFEVFYWKVLSLDRDLDQYLRKDLKPPLKTLDAVHRQLEIFNRKLGSSDESSFLQSKFASFLVSFLLNTVFWKLHKMYFIYYGITASLEKSLHYAKTIIAYVVRNIKKGNLYFNKHPIIIWSVARIALFYSFFDIFADSESIQSLNLDMNEVLQNLPPVFLPQLDNLSYLLSRFRNLKSMWDDVKIIDGNEFFSHPVIQILHNDITMVSGKFMERPSMISGTGPIVPKRDTWKTEVETRTGSAEIRSLVEKFEQNYAIDVLMQIRE